MDIYRDHLVKKAFLLIGAFFLAYIVFYIFPSLFHGGEQMKQLQLLPFLSPVGADLDIYLRFVESWQQGTEFQYSEFNIYPPLNMIFFYPFTWLSYEWAFGLITFLSFISLVYVVVLFPYRMSGDHGTFILSFPALIISLMTYPFLFEIERGQFNLIAMAICFYGIELKKKESRWGYFCFLLSIQLKLFPAIFVFFFAKKDWKKYFYLGGISILMLMSLGMKKFIHFFSAIKTRSSSDTFVSEVNTSIDSFFRLTERVIGEWGNTGVLKILPVLESMAFIFMFAVLALGAVVYLKRETQGVQAAFLLVCTLITLLLPQTSHDYKICYLIGPLLYFVFTLDTKRVHQIAIALIGFCYSSMLWHFWEHKQSSQLFRMNTPSLLIILLLAAIPFYEYFKQRSEGELTSQNK